MYCPNFETNLETARQTLKVAKTFNTFASASTRERRRPHIELALQTLEEMLPDRGMPAERNLKQTVGRVLLDRMQIDAVGCYVDRLLVHKRPRVNVPTDEAGNQKLDLTIGGLPVATLEEIATRVIEILNEFAPHY